MIRVCNGDDPASTWDVAGRVEVCGCGRSYDDDQRSNAWPHASRMAVLQGQMREAAARAQRVGQMLGLR